MKQDIEIILKALEPLIRGSTTDVIESSKKTILSTGLSLFQALTTMDSSTLPDKDAYLALGVKLHNKARNLVNDSYIEVRSLLKSCAAFIFLAVSQNMKLQGAITVLKILSKSGQEFRLFPLLAPHALTCSLNATKVWSRMNADLHTDSMPALELQALKVYAYQAYIDVATSPSTTGDDTRTAIAGAMDTVRSLSVGLKLSFARHALMVGMNQVETDACADSISTFRLVLQVLDGVLANTSAWTAFCADNNAAADGDGSSQSMTGTSDYLLYAMKIKAQLAMVYAYTEMNQPDKALLSLQDLEKSTLKSFDGINCGAADKLGRLEVKQAVWRAKFAAFVRLKDWQDAELSLRALLNITSSHSIALESVVLFLESDPANKRNYASEYYSMLFAKFPQDPEFTKTRLTQLVSVLTQLTFPGDQDAAANATDRSIDPAHRGLDLCTAIVLDHVRGTHELSDPLFLEVVEHCCAQIALRRSRKEWSLVQSWSEIVLRLLQHSVKAIISASEDLAEHSTVRSNGDLDVNRKIVLVMLHKADALSQQQCHTEALEVALAAARLQRDPATLATLFKVSLLGQSGRAAVELLASQLNATQARPGSASSETTALRPPNSDRSQDRTSWTEMYRSSTQGIVKDLDIIVICIKLALELEAENTSSKPACVDALPLLLKEWLCRYQRAKVWLSAGESSTFEPESLSSNAAVSYFAFAGELVRRFLHRNMHAVPVAKPPESTSMFYHVNLPDSSPELDGTQNRTMKRPPDTDETDTIQAKHCRSDVVETPRHGEEDVSVSVPLNQPIAGEISDTKMEVEPDESQATQLQGGESEVQQAPDTTAAQFTPEDQEMLETLLEVVIDPDGSNAKSNESKMQDHVESGQPIDAQLEESGTPEVDIAETSPLLKDGDKGHSGARQNANFDPFQDEEMLQQPGGFQTLFSDGDELRYQFSCSVGDVRAEVLGALRNTLGVVDMVAVEDLTIQLLGSPKHLEWLAEVAWNLAAIILRDKSCSFEGESCTLVGAAGTASGNTTVASDAMSLSPDEYMKRLLLAAELAETAEALYAQVPYEDCALGRMNQCTCLVVASGARLTADITLLHQDTKEGYPNTSKPTSLGLSTVNELQLATPAPTRDNEPVMNNLMSVERNCVKVDTMVRSSLTQAADDTQLMVIRRINLVFHLTLMCKLGGDALGQFVKDRKLEFLQLSADKLIECSEIARYERGGTVEVVRTLLLLAQQACMKEPLTRHSPLSSVFVRLIECSNSKEQALAKIEEFEQLLVCGGTRREVGTLFSEETVHAVLVMAHNFGVTLLHLGDVDLAERFVSKAMNLSRYAPNRAAEVRDSIQCTYTSLLEAKQKQQKRCQSIAAMSNKLGLDFSDGTEAMTERALVDDLAGGTNKRIQDGPLSVANIFT